jgi:hypothetical protein
MEPQLEDMDPEIQRCLRATSWIEANPDLRTLERMTVCLDLVDEHLWRAMTDRSTVHRSTAISWLRWARDFVETCVADAGCRRQTTAEADAPAGHAEAVAPAGSAEALEPAGHAEALAPAGHAEALPPAGHAEALSPAGSAEALAPAGHAEALAPAGHAEALPSAGHAEAQTPAGYAESAGYAEAQTPAGLMTCSGEEAAPGGALVPNTGGSRRQTERWRPNSERHGDRGGKRNANTIWHSGLADARKRGDEEGYRARYPKPKSKTAQYLEDLADAQRQGPHAEQTFRNANPDPRVAQRDEWQVAERRAEDRASRQRSRSERREMT